MTESVIVALITGACAIAAQLVIARQSSRDLYARLEKQSAIDDKNLDAKLEKFQAVTDTKLDALAREVREHNNFARRVPVIEEQIRVANHRIGDLEHMGK